MCVFLLVIWLKRRVEGVTVIAQVLSTRHCARGVDNNPVKWQLFAFYASQRREQDEPLGSAWLFCSSGWLFVSMNFLWCRTAFLTSATFDHRRGIGPPGTCIFRACICPLRVLGAEVMGLSRLLQSWMCFVNEWSYPQNNVKFLHLLSWLSYLKTF